MEKGNEKEKKRKEKKETEISTNDHMPSGIVLLIELFLDEGGNILFPNQQKIINKDRIQRLSTIHCLNYLLVSFKSSLLVSFLFLKLKEREEKKSLFSFHGALVVTKRYKLSLQAFLLYFTIC